MSGSRADARRNAVRVQEAALVMLARHGVDATVMDIAREAGVGKATVYRNFATKEALLSFAAEHHGRWLVERLDATIAADAGWEGFTALVRDTMVRIRTSPMLLEALRPHEGPEPEVGAAIAERLTVLVDTLRDQEWMRADATPDDLGLLIIGSSEYLAARSAGEEQCLRAAELIVDALRAKTA